MVEGGWVDTLSFAAAMRTLIDDARWNFAHVRGDMQGEPSPVIVAYDVTFAVEGALETSVHQLDYFVPIARIDVYRGDDEAAAALVFEAYCERVAAFATGPGTSSDEIQHDDHVPDRPVRRLHWARMSFSTEGPPISVVHFESSPPREGDVAFCVSVEVYGLAVECIEGSPDDSPWRILMGDD
jgi:hypothetical protein